MLLPEQYEEHERELDQLEGDRVGEAVAYSERENANLLKTVERLEKEKADLVAVLGRLVLAFDVGDMAHTTLNGRGYSALADARPLLDIEEE